MNRTKIPVLAALVAVLLLCAASPIALEDDSDALAGNNGMSLNNNKLILYMDLTGPNVSTGDISSYTYTATMNDGTAVPDNAVWSLNDIGNGTNVVTLSNASGPNATVTASHTGSVEIQITCGDKYASAVIVVFSAPGAETDVFYFWIKIDADAVTDANNHSETDVIPQSIILPLGFDINNGFWVKVTKAESELTDFNAYSALNWFCEQQAVNWDFDAQSSGWINTFLNLGTYQGNGSDWIYWSQYTWDMSNSANNNGWSFNNTTLGYLTDVEDSYVGMLFRTSHSPGDPIDAPAVPVGSNTLTVAKLASIQP